MPEVARKDRKDTVIADYPTHLCEVLTTTDEGSPNVFVNGYGAVREGDLCFLHTVLVGLACLPHQVNLFTCSQTVFVNNKGIGRKDDIYGTANTPHRITTGSSNVFAGG